MDVTFRWDGALHGSEQPTSDSQAQAAACPLPVDASERLALLFERYHPRLYSLARRMCGEREEALDLVQECFLRAAHRPERIPPQHPASEAWLVRALVNLCRDRLRRITVRRRHQEQLAPRLASEGDDVRVVARLTVTAALDGLSPRRRAVLVLRELEGRPTREVARLLGLREATVRWHLAGAHRALTAALAASEELPEAFVGRREAGGAAAGGEEEP